MSKTINVFGVSNDIVESYVEREQVDGAFQTALQLNKQIVVYGSSKQGKTSLIKKHLNPESTIIIQCTPAAQLTDVYANILRSSGVKILTESSDKQTTTGEAGGSFRAKIGIPLLLEAEGGTSGKGVHEREQTQEYKHVEYNLNLAQNFQSTFYPYVSSCKWILYLLDVVFRYHQVLPQMLASHQTRQAISC